MTRTRARAQTHAHTCTHFQWSFWAERERESEREWTVHIKHWQTSQTPTLFKKNIRKVDRTMNQRTIFVCFFLSQISKSQQYTQLHQHSLHFLTQGEGRSKNSRLTKWWSNSEWLLHSNLKKKSLLALGTSFPWPSPWLTIWRLSVL